MLQLSHSTVHRLPKAAQKADSFIALKEQQASFQM